MLKCARSGGDLLKLHEVEGHGGEDGGGGVGPAPSAGGAPIINH